MQLRDRLSAGAASFAHLAGIGRTSAARAEDDEDRRPEDDDDKKESRAEGDDPKDDDDEDKKESRRRARRAEDDDDDERAEDDDGDDDSDKEEMRGRSPIARARSRERARCSAIFMSRHAAGNPAMAAELAFNTTLSRKEAIAVLAAAPAQFVPSRSGRAERNPRLGPGGEMMPSSSQAVAQSWDRAFGKAANPLGRRAA